MEIAAATGEDVRPTLKVNQFIFVFAHFLCAKVQFSSSDVCAKVAFQNPSALRLANLLIPRVQNSRFSPITKS